MKFSDETLLAYLEGSLAELRTIMWTLDDGEIQSVDQTISDLQPRITGLLQAHGIHADWNELQASERNLTPEVRRGLYYALQEAVHNVIRHANASHVAFELSKEEHHLRIAVKDNGCGIDNTRHALQQSHGLAGLKQRLSHLGGWLDVESAGRGTSVIFMVPTQ